MTINFYLDTTVNTQSSTRILFVYVRGIAKGKTLKIHSGERLEPKHWDSSKQQVRRSYPGSAEFNSFLAKKTADIQRTYRTLAVDQAGAPYDDIKTALIELFKPQVVETSANEFFAVYEQFIESKRLQYQLNSLNKHKTIIQHLRDYSVSRGLKLNLATINLSFYDDFSAFMLRDKQITNNTYGKYVTAFKTFMTWATERGYCQTTDYKKFRVPTEQVEIIYLTEAELMRLLNHDFSTQPTLERVRDVFCFQCFTGQRFSDARIFEHESAKGNTWQLRTTKTKDILNIPLSSHARTLMEKYKGVGRLPVISSQKTNQYLKEACLLAGIDDIVTIVRYRGTERIELKEPKYKFVSTHTARRTFVTLSLEKGMRPETVMKVTGHKDYKTFKRYIKLTDKVAEQEMRAVWG